MIPGRKEHYTGFYRICKYLNYKKLTYQKTDDHVYYQEMRREMGKKSKRIFETEDSNYEGIRINKFIGDAGICSRREADSMIENGRVTIDGVVAQMGSRVSEGQDVCVDGKCINRDDSLILIALNKPRGIVCTTDHREPENVIDFLNFGKRIYPIGRLDKDSEGLLLLTNDGDIVNKILRGENSHEKEYLVTVNKPITPEFISGMANGVPILETVTKKCFVEAMDKQSFRIVLKQGLNRQIRRMCEHFDYKVTSLQRIRIMNVNMGRLKVGDYRNLTEWEIEELKFQLAESSNDPAAQNKKEVETFGDTSYCSTIKKQPKDAFERRAKAKTVQSNWTNHIKKADKKEEIHAESGHTMKTKTQQEKGHAQKNATSDKKSYRYNTGTSKSRNSLESESTSDQKSAAGTQTGIHKGIAGTGKGKFQGQKGTSQSQKGTSQGQKGTSQGQRKNDQSYREKFGNKKAAAGQRGVAGDRKENQQTAGRSFEQYNSSSKRAGTDGARKYGAESQRTHGTDGARKYGAESQRTYGTDGARKYGAENARKFSDKSNSDFSGTDKKTYGRTGTGEMRETTNQMKNAHGNRQDYKGQFGEHKNEYRGKQSDAGKARGNERTGSKTQYGTKSLRGGKPGNHKQS